MPRSGSSGARVAPPGKVTLSCCGATVSLEQERRGRLDGDAHRRAVELDLVARHLVLDAQRLLAGVVVEREQEAAGLEGADVRRVVVREVARRCGNLGGAAGLAPVAAEVVGVVDVALVEQDADLGALLGHGEEAAGIAAAAHGAEWEGPGARGFDQAGDPDAHAAEALGVGATDDVADVEAVFWATRARAAPPRADPRSAERSRSGVQP